MELQVLSLSDSLKAKKKKLRAAIEQLLTLSAMQHNVLVTTFQDKISNFSQNIYQLQHHTERLTNDNQKSIEHLTKQHDRQINDNQRSIERLTKQHFRQICKLESEYREQVLDGSGVNISGLRMGGNTLLRNLLVTSVISSRRKRIMISQANQS